MVGYSSSAFLLRNAWLQTRCSSLRWVQTKKQKRVKGFGDEPFKTSKPSKQELLNLYKSATKITFMTFHYADWFIGILILASYNPNMTG